MKLVTAVIKPFKLDEVKEAVKVAGITGLTVSQVRGFGRTGGHIEVFRGKEYVFDFVDKLQIEDPSAPMRSSTISSRRLSRRHAPTPSVTGWRGSRTLSTWCASAPTNEGLRPSKGDDSEEPPRAHAAV